MELFDGFSVSLSSFNLNIAPNPDIAAGPYKLPPPTAPAVDISQQPITGTITLPFFSDPAGPSQAIDIVIITHRLAAIPPGVDNDNSLFFDIALAPVQSDPNRIGNDGKVKIDFTIQPPGPIGQIHISVQMTSLHLQKRQHQNCQFTMKGTLYITTPDYPIQWPTVDFTGLAVDSQGNVEMDDTWINLPSPADVRVGPADLSLTAVGFGTDPYLNVAAPQRWIGFSGGIKVDASIKIGGSVRGLRLNLDSGRVELNGIKISFSVPDLLDVSGEVDFARAQTKDDMKNLNSPIPLPTANPTNPPPSTSSYPFPVNLFLGDLKVSIKPIKLELQAKFLAGKIADGTPYDTTVLFIYLAAKFPGILLFADISLFGLEGLFAANLRPDPTIPDSNKQTHDWWQWYKFPTSTSGAILTGPNPAWDPTKKDKNGKVVGGYPDGTYTATDPTKWLYPNKGAFAIGAGVALGTSVDDGFTVNADVMLALLFPGPVIMIVGQADVLKKRGATKKHVGDFHAMAALDFGADTFLIAIGWEWDLPFIISIKGDAELFVQTSKSPQQGQPPPPSGWYFALGKPPREQRVSAKVLDGVFEMDVYFVIDQSGLILGAYQGMSLSWDFGPLSVDFNAYIASLLAMNWSPLQVGGGMEFHGEVDLKAFGIGLGLTADALVEACAPNPFWVHGEFDVELDLPWPLPNVGATISLTWGGDDGSVPPAPLALQHIDALMGDHASNSDHYTLLAHSDDPVGEPSEVDYDKTYTGLLSMDSSNENQWKALVGPAANTNPGDTNYDTALTILPDLIPDLTSATQVAAVVPQDVHFTLTFAHPTADHANPAQDGPGFANGTDPSKFPSDIESAIASDGSVGSILPKDDMSDINPNPPQPQWEYQHFLRQVSLYAYDNNAGWQLIASTPQLPGALDLPGGWMPAARTTGTPQPNTLLKVAPYSMLAGSKVNALPYAPALYALKTITRIEARRVGDSNAVMQRVPDGDPIVEFAYFQTAGGPGLGTLSATAPAGNTSPWPDPAMPPPYPNLAANAKMSDTIFPSGGALQDLHTYVQWSWPDNGGVAAYYGYDLTVEFNEDTVNYMYAALANGYDTDSLQRALHLRCRDRNHQHTLFKTIGIRPPSIPQQTAITGAAWVPDVPAPAINALEGQPSGISPQPDTPSGTAITQAVPNWRVVSPGTWRTIRRALQLRASVDSVQSPFARALSPKTTPADTQMSAAASVPQFTPQASAALAAFAPRADTAIPTSWQNLIVSISPAEAAAILLQIEEIQAAQALEQNWFKPLSPRTFYAVDIVGGDFIGVPRYYMGSPPNTGTLTAILQPQNDAIDAWQALQDFYTAEDARTSLYHFEFYTSRYATFTSHMASATAQDPAVSGNIRRYGSPQDPQTWFGANRAAYDAASAAYLTAAQTLASTVANFAPGAGYFPSTSGGMGEQDILTARESVNTAWNSFSTSASAAYDGLITALGFPELASGQHTPLPAQTELSFFAPDDMHIATLLLESPEPFAWRRIWQWVTLTPADPESETLQGVIALWSVDSTRALIVPMGVPAGTYTLAMEFQGIIGAEAPCITSNGTAVLETVTFKPLPLAPYPPRIVGHPHRGIVAASGAKPAKTIKRPTVVKAAKSATKHGGIPKKGR
ncbi:MAG: hypothetical protein ACYDHM_08595 [Acidiferrobacterales bacterium]